MYDVSEFRIARELKIRVENELNRVGILSRVFSRAKSSESIESKLKRENGKYSVDGRKIQDLFGVRVALYFPDDNDISQEAMKNIFEFDAKSSTIDLPDKDTFSAIRCNLIFKLPEEYISQSEVLTQGLPIDNTFEIQFRTVLSEGWHEVEHDLRYKCKSDWGAHDDLSRALNGIYASLEVSEWSMLKLFEELAHRHYKSSEWAQMIRTKFRLRIGNILSSKITHILDNDHNLAKKLYRINRNDFIGKMLEDNIKLPKTLDNLFYLSNHYYLKSDVIEKETPEPIRQICRELNES